jgi:aminocarboxymuconate-semialdehyde decarboxylase
MGRAPLPAGLGVDLTGGTHVPTVDVHTHMLLPRVEELVAGQPGLLEQQSLEARRFGGGDPNLMRRTIAPILPKLLDVDVRLSDMDAAGVDVHLVSPSPSHYHYWAEPTLATEIFHAAHEGIAAACARDPRRLVGLGLAPLQHTDVAVASLDHAWSTGLKGVEICTYAPGLKPSDLVRDLSDPALEPFWTRAAELGALVFLHPFGCTLEERLSRWYLSNIVGNPVETAVALSHLIFSGILDRHPDLRLIAAHGGGYLPTYIGRSDHGWSVRAESHDCAEPPSAYLRRLWYDSLVHSPLGLRHLVESVGADRVLLGSDYPFDMGTPDPVSTLAATDLAPDEVDAISGATAVDLLNLSAWTH